MPPFTNQQCAVLSQSDGVHWNEVAPLPHEAAPDLAPSSAFMCTVGGQWTNSASIKLLKPIPFHLHSEIGVRKGKTEGRSTIPVVEPVVVMPTHRHSYSAVFRIRDTARDNRSQF